MFSFVYLYRWWNGFAFRRTTTACFYQFWIIHNLHCTVFSGGNEYYLQFPCIQCHRRRPFVMGIWYICRAIAIMLCALLFATLILSHSFTLCTQFKKTQTSPGPEIYVCLCNVWVCAWNVIFVPKYWWMCMCVCVRIKRWWPAIPYDCNFFFVLLHVLCLVDIFFFVFTVRRCSHPRLHWKCSISENTPKKSFWIVYNLQWVSVIDIRRQHSNFYRVDNER